MVWRLEFFLKLYCLAVTVLHLNVVPGIYIYFLNSRTENIFCKERKFSHFGVQLVDQLLLSHALRGNAVVEKIFSDIPFYLSLDLVVALIYVVYAVDNEGGIFT